MSEELFQPLPTNSDLSICAIEWAAHVGLPPSYMFELHVHPYLLVTARHIVRQIHADQKDHPLSPFINVIADERITNRHGWFVQSGDVRIGSEGCG